jgi:hypothetical protein
MSREQAVNVHGVERAACDARPMRELVLVIATGCVACAAPFQGPKIGSGILAAVSAATLIGCVGSAVDPNPPVVCGNPEGLVALSGLSLVGLIILNLVDVIEEERRLASPKPRVPGHPAPIVEQKSEARRLANNATTRARDGHCDQAVEIARQVLPLDKEIHTSLMTTVEMKRCIVPANQPAP